MGRLATLLFPLTALVALSGAAQAEAPPAAQADSPAPAAESPPAPAEAEATTDVSAPDVAGLESLLGEAVVSSASRTAETTSEAPATVWTISGTDLKRFGIQSVEEAVRYLGHAITSYEFDQRMNTAFGVRGYLSGNLGLHLAVLIDGNQAGGSSMTARGTAQYLMPIELVDHLELVIGPGSVMYGNSAMLGVINVVTRSGASLEGPQLVLQASGGTPGDPWARNVFWGEAWGRSAVYGGTKLLLGGEPLDLAWHFAVRWDRQQGRAVWRRPENIDPFTEPEAFWREDVFNRDAHARLFARASWGRHTLMAWLGHGDGTGTGPIAGLGKSSYDEPEVGLDWSWHRPVAERGDFAFRAYAVMFDSTVTTFPPTLDSQNCLDEVGTTPCHDRIEYVSVKPFVEPTFRWDWQGDGKHVSTVGAQAFIDGSVITSSVLADQGSAEHAKRPVIAPIPNAALFAQHIWRGSFLTLNLGLRGDLGLLGSALSPRIALSKSPWEGGTLKALFSTGFRTPTLTERFLEIPGFLTSNPDIGPERVSSVEVDLAQKLGLQSLQVALFATSWQGIITTRGGVVVDGVSLTQFTNLRNVWSAGINAGWQGSFGPVDWGLSASYAPGRVRLPADVASYSDEQLEELNLERAGLVRYGLRRFGQLMLPADGNPDFYATGHISVPLEPESLRLSLAVHLDSPRPFNGYLTDPVALDERHVHGSWLPWSVDVRGGFELKAADPVDLRFLVTGRSLPLTAGLPRVGDANQPLPGGGIGHSPSPVAPLSAMAEVSVRL